MHGVLQIIEKALGWQKYEGRNWAVRIARIAVTFLLVNFAWVFFRMPSIGDAFGLIGSMVSNFGTLDLSDFGGSAMIMSFVGLSILLLKDVKDEYLFDRLSFLGAKIVRWAIYIILFCMILNFGVLDGGQFIYVSF